MVLKHVVFVAAFFASVCKSGLIEQLGILPDEGSRTNGLGETVNGTFRNIKNCYKIGQLDKVMGKSISDPDLGDFPLTLEYCDKLALQCNRGIGVCCSVMPADDVIYKFWLFKSISQTERIELNWRDPKEIKNFEGCRSIVYIVHGFLESYDLGSWMKLIKDGYLKRDGTCVVIVDWRLGNKLVYYQALQNVRIVGAAIGFTVWKWNLGDKTLLVGFSLGGHVIGEAGKFFTKKTGKKVAECHALDPAGPGFDKCSPQGTLLATDCNLVQVLHTTSEVTQADHLSFITGGAGSAEKRGKCDFFVNGGYGHDGCAREANFTELVIDAIGYVTKNDFNTLYAYQANQLVGCGHFRAPLMYASVLNNDCKGKKPIQGIPCPKCRNFPLYSRKPDDNKNSVRVMIGFECPKEENYYVTTSLKSPFCPD